MSCEIIFFFFPIGIPTDCQHVNNSYFYILLKKDILYKEI